MRLDRVYIDGFKNLKEVEKSMSESLARFKGLIEKTSAAGSE